MQPRLMTKGFAVALCVLLLCWLTIIWIVGPAGEFMVNDDWSFVKILDALRNEGRLIATGWGGGGPAAIIHVLWGWLFTEVFGYSMTVVRVSVLFLGIACSVVLLALLKNSGASSGLALFGALTLAFNPLFLSQCFTYMTDVTFVAMICFSLLCFQLGVVRSDSRWIGLGTFLALCSILTRQLGVVIALAFVVAYLIHPHTRSRNRGRVGLLVLAAVFIPWLAYELFLSYVGSTPVIEHQILRNLWQYLAEAGPAEFLDYAARKRIPYALLYTSLFVLPMVALNFRKLLKSKLFIGFVLTATAALVAIEYGILVESIDPPVKFYRNVIYDLGIGPILLKDTYILRIPRNITIPVSLYYFIVYWAVVSFGSILFLIARYLRQLTHCIGQEDQTCPSFISLTALIAAGMYLGIIIMTGFHDRYLIPVCLFMLVWHGHYSAGTEYASMTWKQFVPASLFLVPLIIWSPGAVHDFIAMKRAVNQAQSYVRNTLAMEPCDFDGGFEFNGYHCYNPTFERKKGQSWWWVNRENAVLTLGPVPGYSTVAEFPFKRYVGTSGAAHVLMPINRAHE